VLLRRHPILLQGPTSSGKTSLVEYLAHRTGHRFMRINNHEHTDLQEYLGTYVTDETGACANFLRPVFPATSSLAVFPNSVGTGARKVAEHQRGYLTCLRRRTLA
jgi:MoxR-like ATPase